MIGWDFCTDYHSRTVLSAPLKEKALQMRGLRLVAHRAGQVWERCARLEGYLGEAVVYVMSNMNGLHNLKPIGHAGAQTDRWMRIGIWLVIATMTYNIIEAVIALWSGMKAGSIALVGFGLDSVIECVAASALLWRLRVEARNADDEYLLKAEHIVHQVVGITFIFLALYVIGQASWILWQQNAPEESTVGIILAIASLVIMPVVSWGKFRVAREIGSAAMSSEAKETLACSYLSFTLLLGLVVNAILGWWWADPVAALLMIPWLVKEGQEGIRQGVHNV